MAEQLITYQIVIATFLVLIALLFSIRHKYSKTRTQTGNLLLLEEGESQLDKSRDLARM